MVFECVYDNYNMFVDACTSTNCVPLKEQLQPLTNNRTIYIDMTCNVHYWFDEHFFDIRFWDWEHYENKCNITFGKTKKNPDLKYQGRTEDVTQFGVRITVHFRY